MAEIIKRIGPANYWCRRCAHCNSVELGCMGDAPIYTCGDPYDGVEKKIPGDENITCTMFELANEEELKELKEKYSELELRKEELENKLNAKNKDIDILLDENKRLKWRNDNQVTMIEGLKLQYNDLSEKLKKTDISKVPKLEVQINNLKYLNEASYKREEELEKKLKRVESHDEALTKHFQNDEALINNIQKVIFPQEEGSDYTYSYDEILNKVKDLKVQSDENGIMYEEIKELRAKNQAYFNEISDRLAKHTDQCDEITKLKNENISLNTINKGLADDLRAAKDKLNYLYFKAKEFANKED